MMDQLSESHIMQRVLGIPVLQSIGVQQWEKGRDSNVTQQPTAERSSVSFQIAAVYVPATKGFGAIQQQFIVYL